MLPISQIQAVHWKKIREQIELRYRSGEYDRIKDDYKRDIKKSLREKNGRMEQLEWLGEKLISIILYINI